MSTGDSLWMYRSDEGKWRDLKSIMEAGNGFSLQDNHVRSCMDMGWRSPFVMLDGFFISSRGDGRSYEGDEVLISRCGMMVASRVDQPIRSTTSPRMLCIHCRQC